MRAELKTLSQEADTFLKIPKFQRSRIYIYLCVALLTVSGCSVFGPSDESKALDFARLSCGIEKLSADSGEPSESGTWVYHGVDKDKAGWNGRTISMVDLTQKLDKHKAEAEEAVNAANLNDDWQKLSEEQNKMYAFVSRIYSMRKSQSYDDSQINSTDYNNPLYSVEIICNVVLNQLLEKS